MKYFKLSLAALTAIFALSTGISHAGTSMDCGDENAKPINTHGKAKTAHKKV